MYYYTDNKKIFSNKLEALKYKQETKQSVYINYYDEVYSTVSWVVEPLDTLDTLYKQQAQRIRDEYDYVVLCYSGGYDSTNILETFHYNNIKLDKIVVAGPYSRDTTTDIDQNHNGEVYNNAFPYLKELGLDSIVQAIDYTELYDNPANFSIYQFGDDWVNHIGARHSPHHFFWRDVERHVVPKEYQNKRIAIIWGIDKPVLKEDKITKELFFEFSDMMISSYGKFNKEYRFNTSDINFYWDPAAPLILIKQLHLIKNLFLTQNITLPYKTDSITGKGLVELIYNFKKPILYKSGKSPLVYIGKRDMFLLKKQPSEIYKFYENGLKKLYGYDLRGIQSKKYIIYKP